MDFETLLIDGKPLTSNSSTYTGTACVPQFDGACDTTDGCGTELVSGQWYTHINNVYLEHGVELGDDVKRSGVDGYYYGNPTRGSTIMTIEGCIVAYDECTAFEAMMKIQNVYALKSASDCNGYSLITWSCGDDCVIDSTLAVSQSDNSDTIITGAIGGVSIKFNGYYKTPEFVSIYTTNDGISYSLYQVVGGYNYPSISVALPNNNGIKLEYSNSIDGTIDATIDTYIEQCVPIRKYKAYGQVIQKPIFNQGTGGVLVRSYEAKIRIKDYIYDGGEPVVITGLLEGDRTAVETLPAPISTEIECCANPFYTCNTSNSCNTCCTTGAVKVNVQSCTDAYFDFCIKLYWSGLALEDDVNAFPNGDPLGGVIGYGIRIENINSGDYILLDSSYKMKRDDVVTICTSTQSVYVNGILSNNIVSDASIFPQLTGGENNILVSDMTNTGMYGQLIAYDISFTPIV